MQLSAVDLNLLPVLHAILEARSVKAAAPRLGLSPSAVSHALARLRDLLGDPLLVRAGRQMLLTPRAERMRARVQHLVDELDLVLRPEDGVEPSRLSRSFTIAGSDLVELTLLAPLGRRLARLAPQVDLYGEHVEEYVATQLRAGRCDLLVGVFGEQPDDIHVQDLLVSHFVCLLREGHPVLEGRLTLRRYAALDHVLIAPRGVPRGIVDRLLEERGLERRIARTVSSFVVAPYLVAHTDSVLTVSNLVAAPLAGPLGLVIRKPPLPVPSFTIRMAWHRRNEEDAAHGWLREQVAEQAAEIAAGTGA